MGIWQFLESKRFAFLLFAFLSFIFLLPTFSNIQNWGSYDWDQHLFYHGSAWVSIVKYHQFPLWNPFYCGGSPLMANPQSTFLSPFFLLILAFGPVAGIKIEILAYLVIGLFGMFMAARRLGVKPLPAYLAAIIFMFSSWFAARVVVGHTTFLPFALLPWVFYCYLQAQSRKVYLFPAALLMAVMFFSGGIYPFYFTCIFLGLYALLDSLEQKSFWPAALVAIIFALALGISAVKLLPMLQFTGGVSTEDIQFSNLGFLLKGLESRNQDIDTNDMVTGRSAASGDSLVNDTLEGKLAWGWHEYSAYLGIIPLLLLALAAFSFRRCWKLLIIALFLLVLSLGDFSPLPVWSFIKGIPFIGALHGPSRLLIVFVFCASLLAARAVSDFKPLNKPWFSVVIILIVFLDLFLVSRPLLAGAFPTEPLNINTYEYPDYIHVAALNKFTSQYPHLLQNLDTTNCYERVHPRNRVVPQFFDDGDSFPGFIGNAYIAETNQTFNISFSPNNVVVDSSPAGTLVFAQNYLPGWTANGKPAASYEGLVSTTLSSPGNVVFAYSPSIFYIGLALSLLSLIAGGFICWKWRQ